MIATDLSIASIEEVGYDAVGQRLIVTVRGHDGARMTLSLMPEEADMLHQLLGALAPDTAAA